MSGLNFNVNEQVTGLAPVKPIAKLNDLTPLKLISVTLEEVKSEKDNSTYEYNGVSLPSIKLVFHQARLTADEADREFIYSLRPVSHTKKSGETIIDKNLDKFYTDQFKTLKHILDEYSFAPNWANVTKLPSFVHEDTMEARLKKWKQFYQAFVTAFNEGKDKKAIFMNDKGVSYDMIAKLIVNSDEQWVSFPRELGKVGFIQKYKLDKEGKLITTLELKASETVRWVKPEKKDASITETQQKADLNINDL